VRNAIQQTPKESGPEPGDKEPPTSSAWRLLPVE
jgi:hypothetical protein